MKLKKGDIVRFDFPSIRFAANKWATAIYQGTTYTDEDGGELISLKWIRDGNDNGQDDGEYYSHMFTKVEEVSTQEEDRILKENKKDMKFDFENGKKLLVDYFDSEFEKAYGYSLDYIKDCSTMSEIEVEIESFRRYEKAYFNRTTDISGATTLREVFNALEDSDLEDDDDTIMSFFVQERN